MRGRSKMREWYKQCMQLFSTFHCTSVLSENVRAYSAGEQRMHRKRAKLALKRAAQHQWAQGWVRSLAPTGKLSPHLAALSNSQLRTVCIPMHIHDGSLSYIHTYTQCRGWVDSGVRNTNGQYCSLPALCREALLLFRTGVAPQWIHEGNIDRNIKEPNRFMRTCEYCERVHNLSFVHDAFHVLFDCPLFEHERTILCQRVTPDVVREYLGIQHSLFELHIMLLCPPTVAIASAVGQFLACSIAKLGMFRALTSARLSTVIGPIHYMQSVMQYDGRWVRALRNSLNNTRSMVVDMYSQAVKPFVRNPTFTAWANQCVIHKNVACSLLFMLPTDWRQVVADLVPTVNRTRFQPAARNTHMLVGRIL